MQIVFLDSDLSRHDFYKAVLKEIASEDEIHFSAVVGVRAVAKAALAITNNQQSAKK